MNQLHIKNFTDISDQSCEAVIVMITKTIDASPPALT